jgi:hypothetical protein
MKREQLQKLLQETAGDEAKVSGRLHQDVMRAVRLAKPVARKARTDWRIPALGTAMSLAVFYFLQTTAVNQLPPSEQAYSGNLLINTPLTALTALEDQLATLSQHTLVPEKELKAELERLKADLKRFDFRS